ncbi:Sir2 family [Nesidiocoris tenuis]|uniref:Sir2 family n=1 Tax=Nesidiocoris tenuis TaxID=355587 RepID=A0ABN7AQA4_9HEMI|nr:Sir2 family [Nesidiocoris tenuis]
MEWVPEGFKSTHPKRFKFDTEEMDPNKFEEPVEKSSECIETIGGSPSREPSACTSSLAPEPGQSDDSKDRLSSSDVELGESSRPDEDDDDDTSSYVSTVSDLSCLSDMSGQNWKPMSNIFSTLNWIRKQKEKGVDPRVVLNQITGENTEISDFVPDFALWRMIFSFLTENPKRYRLPKVSTIDDVIDLIKNSKKIIVLTGAGVSVSCGIPDFRSKDGLYARLAVDYPDLFDPQAMFSIDYFRKNPRPFFKFAKEMYPGQFKPSPSHRFIKMIEKRKKLLRNYTQNIDTLEKVAGIENVIECHGSFATASCTTCGHRVSCDDIKPAILEQRIPYCEKCAASHVGPWPADVTECDKGVMKPDIVFFGEGLPDAFHKAMEKDSDECDLLIVMGSSLKVKPVALIPSSIPAKVPQVLINRERLPHMNFDVELLGDSDSIVDQLCRMLGEEWNEVCWRETPLSDVTSQLPPFSNYGLSFDSEEEEEDEENEENTVVENTAPVKCQKIGKRHVPGDESTRHVSLDSSRDSGIGESSNSSNEGSSPRPSGPIVNENTFYCLGKRKYVFPGAEVPGLPSFLSAV